MSLKRTSKHVHSTMSELNITPLLDLVFVLLVIFIITTPQMLNSLTTTLPNNQKPPENQKKPTINRIEVDDEGQVFLNSQVVTTPQLKTDLKRLKDADSEMAVVVKGSDVVEYQKMVTVLDVLQQLDITKIGLATQ